MRVDRCRRQEEDLWEVDSRILGLEMAASGDYAVGSVLGDMETGRVLVGSKHTQDGGDIGDAAGDDCDIGKSPFEDVEVIVASVLG